MQNAEKVKSLIVDHLGCKPEDVTDYACFVTHLGADSLDIVELVMAFEEEFGIEITDDEGHDVNTVADAVKLVDSKCQSAAA